jgi:hypothetical protein
VRVFFNNLRWILTTTTADLEYCEIHLSEIGDQNSIYQTQPQQSANAVSFDHMEWLTSNVERRGLTLEKGFGTCGSDCIATF